MDASFNTLPPQYFNPATPAGFDPRTQTFALYSYDDVAWLSTDRTTFTSDFGIDEADLPNLNPGFAGMWATDGQRHDRLRHAVADPFRHNYLDSLRKAVREIAVELVEDMPTSGPYDITEMTRLLPSRVMCLILDLPPEAAVRMLGWMDEVSTTTTVVAFPPQPELSAYFADEIARRKREPGTGLLTELVKAQAAGAPVTDWDLIGYGVTLLAAGIDTTTASLSNALLFLSEYGHMNHLAAHPEQIPAAVEESLRWYPSFPTQTRLTTREIELHGQTFPPRTPISGYLTSANRDPAHFPDPNRFDPTRHPNQHLSFGRGRHFCLGAPLARLQLTIALEEVVARRPHLKWDKTVPLQRHHGIVHRLTKAVFQMS